MVVVLEPGRADVDAWSALAATASEPNPFFEPELLLPAVAHLGGDGVRLLVATGDGGDWIGLAPVLRARQFRRVPGLVEGVWRHRDCFFGAPLLAPGREAEALDALVGELRGRAGLVPLEYLPADGPVATALDAVLEGARPHVWDTWERAALQRREADDYVETMLSSRRRRELRRQRGHLETEVGGTLACVDASEDPVAVDTFLALEAAGWKSRAGTPLDPAFFHATCDGLRARGRLQLLQLRAGERVVATKCNVVSGAGVFCFKIAYDETLARFSPGVQLELDNVHVFHGHTELQWEDSCADPANEMINRLWPDRRRLVSLLVPGTGVRGQLGRLQGRAALRARSFRTTSRPAEEDPRP
jgi:CelD/BcsL family acetyltransferase involved in cellulose biosynthesis